MSADYRFETRDGAFICHLQKSSIASEHHPLYEAVRKKIELEKPEKFVLNLQDLTYTDSAGIQFFIILHTTINDYGGSCYFVNVGPEISKFLEVTKVNKLIQVRPDIEAALA